MKIQIFAAIFLSALLSVAYAYQEKVIYDEDDRRLITELSSDDVNDALAIKSAPSILAQIPNWRIDYTDPAVISVRTKDLKSALNFCDGEKYLDQPLVSGCTAFLVGPDLIVTAGHCIKDKYDCKKQSWVLDYDSPGSFIGPTGTISFDKDKTFACRELVSWSQNLKLDYAVVRLDREVVGREPLKVRREGKTSSKEDLMVIGHPLGMPKIVTNNITIRDNSLDFVFKTNADTFSGNSGSPVFGLKSGLVEGILIRGENDFADDYHRSCKRPLKCYGNECKGESVQRSTYLPFKHIPKI